MLDRFVISLGVLIVYQVYFVHGQQKTTPALDLTTIRTSNESCLSDQGDCFCDEQCMDYDDCCPDYIGLNQTGMNGTKPQPAITQCIHATRTFADDPSLEKYDTWFQAVAECPPGTSENLAKLCSRTHANRISFMTKSDVSHLVKDIVAVRFLGLQFWILKADIRSMAPVVSRSNGRVYANIHCAECYGEVDLTQKSRFRDVVKAGHRKLDYFDVDIRCRRDDQESRLCFARSSLPRSLKRPCRERIVVPLSASQFMFSQSDFRWEELLIVPDNFYDEEPENATLPEIIVDSIYNILQIVVCIISSLSLMILIGVYTSDSNLRSRLSSQLTIGLAVYLIGLLTVYLTIPVQGTLSPDHVRMRCMLMAGTLLYFFLGSFVWMAAFGFNLMQTFGGHHMIALLAKQIWSICRGNKDQGSLNMEAVGAAAMKGMVISSANRQQSGTNKRLIISTIVSVLAPLIFVIPALIINEEVYPNECLKAKYRNDSERSTVFCTPEEIQLAELTPGFCPLENPTRPWFTQAQGWRIWFLTPTTFLLVLNCLILIIVGSHIWSLKKSPMKETDDSGKRSGIPKSHKQMVRICLNLSITLGIVWIFQLLASMMPELPWLNQIASLMSSGQGLAITVLSLINTKYIKGIRSWTEIVSRRRATSTATTSGTSKKTESTGHGTHSEALITNQ